MIGMQISDVSHNSEKDAGDTSSSEVKGETQATEAEGTTTPEIVLALTKHIAASGKRFPRWDTTEEIEQPATNESQVRNTTEERDEPAMKRLGCGEIEEIEAVVKTAGGGKTAGA